MHMFSAERQFFGGHGIVGAPASIGTGLALANCYRDNKGVAFVYFGDGASNQGQVYEAFNMASLWALPVVYLIENNQYGMGTLIERSSSETHLYRRGPASTFPATRWMAWTFWQCATPRPRPPSMRAPQGADHPGDEDLVATAATQ